MEYITLILGCVLVNNVALTAFGGLDTIAVSSRKKINVKTLAFASAIVITVSVLICSLLNDFVLEKFNFTYLITLADVAIVMIVAAVVENYTSLKLGKFAALTVLNGATLVICLTVVGTVEAMIATAIGSGLGFALAMLVYRSIRTRINDKYVPASFRGLPVDLMVIAIMAMAVTAFK